MDRSSTVGGGFGVDPAVLAGVANHLDGLAEDAVAGARHEYTAAAGGPAVLHQRRDQSGVGAALGAALGASQRLPDWLPDRDAAWQQQRAGLVGATRAAAAALFGTASTYRDVEDRVDPRSQSHHGQVAAAPSAARVSPVAVATAASAVLTDTAEISSAEDGNSLEFAIALWRHRSTATNNTVHALTGTRAAPPGWTGLAANTYTEWLHLHRGQWQALHEDAIRIRDALAAHDTPRPTTTGPAAVPAVLSPAALHHAISPHRLLMSGEPTPDAPPAGDTAATNAASSSGPQRHPMDPVPTLLTPGTATPPKAQISAWADADPIAPPGLAPTSADTNNTDTNNTDTDTDSGPTTAHPHARHGGRCHGRTELAPTRPRHRPSGRDHERVYRRRYRRGERRVRPHLRR